MMIEELLNNPYFALVSLVVGSAVTWFFAWLYYKKAGDELKAESEKLRKATNLILYRLLNPDAELTPKYDNEGNVSGFIVAMSGHVAGAGSARALNNSYD